MTIAYQELLKSRCETQSHSHILEPLTLTLRVNDSTSIQPSYKSWGAIEALSSSKRTEVEDVYVHPLARRSLSSLSSESLELCTESLGSETGAFIPLSSCENEAKNSTRKRNNNDQHYYGNNKVENCINSSSTNSKMNKFPPPLTTMRGSNSIMVRSYREEGRLVIKAVSTPPRQSCFRVERSDGRIKLYVVRVSSSENDDVDNEIGFDECVRNEGDEGNEQDGEERGENGTEIIEKSEEEKGEDMSGIKMDFGVKMGIADQLNQWPTRCKENGRENNKRLINLKPFWVAT